MVIERRWTGGTFPPPNPPPCERVVMNVRVSSPKHSQVTRHGRRCRRPVAVTRTRTPPPARGHGQHTRHTHVIRVSGHRYRTVGTQPACAGCRWTGQQGSTDTPKTAHTRVRGDGGGIGGREAGNLQTSGFEEGLSCDGTWTTSGGLQLKTEAVA